MLQSGAPGTTILLESDDLQTIGIDDDGDCEDESNADGREGNVPGSFLRTNVQSRSVPTADDDEDGSVSSDEDEEEEEEGDSASSPPLSFSLVSTQGVPTPFVPDTVPHITVLTNVQTTPDNFLSESSGLKSIDLSHLKHVRSLGTGFLFECTSLTNNNSNTNTSIETEVTVGHTDDSHLPILNSNNNTTTSSSSSSVAFDLTSLSHSLVEVSSYFLSGCTHLKRLDFGLMSSLSNITIIRSAFLYGCSGLEEVDLSPLVNVVEVHDHFLSGCSGLATLDILIMSQLKSPLSPPQQQQQHPPGQQLVALAQHQPHQPSSPLQQQQQQQQQLLLHHPPRLHRGFLCECSGLKYLDLAPMSHFTSLAPYFLASCSSLANLDLTPLSRVTLLPEGFLFGCSGLEGLDMAPMSTVATIEPRFLFGCSRLRIRGRKASSPGSSLIGDDGGADCGVDLSLLVHLQEVPLLTNVPLFLPIHLL